MKRQCSRTKRPGGFLFIELLFVIGMLGVASLLGAEIFRTAGQTLTESAKQQTSELQIDQALSHLRADVWSASALACENGHSLLIRSAGRSEVRWEASGALSRIGPGGRSPLRWDRIDATIVFEVHGPTLTVRLERGPHEAAEVVLVSQNMLLEGGGR